MFGDAFMFDMCVVKRDREGRSMSETKRGGEVDTDRQREREGGEGGRERKQT